MKRTILLTIMAMSLTLGASRANMPAGTNKAEEHQRLAKWMQVGGEGLLAAKDPAEQQKPALLTLPGHADREKPLLLIAPICHGSCTPSSLWQQFQSALSSVFYWI
jgi:hypothetical protein